MLQFILLFQLFVFHHDIALANFEINQENDILSLYIKIDREDLNHVYFLKHKELIDLTQKKEFIQKYLDKHFHLLVNQNEINFSLENVDKDKLFYKIELLSQDKVQKKIRHIQLENTCLIEHVDNHSNIVNFQINGRYRTFRLHKGRITIDLRY